MSSWWQRDWQKLVACQLSAALSRLPVQPAHLDALTSVLFRKRDVWEWKPMSCDATPLPGCSVSLAARSFAWRARLCCQPKLVVARNMRLPGLCGCASVPVLAPAPARTGGCMGRVPAHMQMASLLQSLCLPQWAACTAQRRCAHAWPVQSRQWALVLAAVRVLGQQSLLLGKLQAHVPAAHVRSAHPASRALTASNSD